VDVSQAIEVLELQGESFSPDEVKDAQRKVVEKFEKKIKEAPTKSLRQKYERKLDEIEEAGKLLLDNGDGQAGFNLSQTQLGDLPISNPVYTGLGYTGIGDRLDSSITLSIGKILLDRYEIHGLLGAGGMGAVYSVFDRMKGEQIAIKLLLPRLLGNVEARKRFLNEAKIASALAHPNIVNVFDIQNDGDLYFITMEKLEGRNLRSAMNEKKANGEVWSVEQVCTIGNQICEALSYAHASTVHRDIKPENIWLCNDGQVKIMDFGIARLGTISQHTGTYLQMGTAYYMAPEQLQNSKDIDHRADQYSVGAVIYEMLTGQVPSGRFKEPKKGRKDISSKLSSTVMQALESNPHDRLPDMASFGDVMKKNQSGFLSKFGRALFISFAVVSIITFFVLFKPIHGPIKSTIGSVISYFSPQIQGSELSAVKSQLVNLEYAYTQIMGLKESERKPKEDVIDQLKKLIEDGKILKKNEEYRDLQELLNKEVIDRIVKELKQPLSGLLSRRQARIDAQKKNLEDLLKAKESYITKLKSNIDNLRRQIQRQGKNRLIESELKKENRLLAIHQELLDSSKKFLKDSELRIDADAACIQGEQFFKEELFVDSLRKYELAKKYYIDLLDWYKPAESFIFIRHDYKLEDVLGNFKKSFPFTKEPFFENFRTRDNASLLSLQAGKSDEAVEKFERIKKDLIEAREISNSYIKHLASLKNLKSKMPNSSARQLDKIINRLKDVLVKVADHEFDKVTGIFKDVETQKFYLVKDVVKKELSRMEANFSKGQIYPVFLALNKFNRDWGSVLEPKYKRCYVALKEKVENPTISLGNNISIKLKLIPGGKFRMGSPADEFKRDYDEGPAHEVSINYFWIGKFEITQAQYKKVTGRNPSTYRGNLKPVENVSWYEAKNFCAKLSRLTQKQIRLPSEAEWEYCCRAGTQTPYYWGTMWDSSKSWSGVKNTTNTVGSLTPNRWELYDMSGNVWEWCEDMYDETFYTNSTSKSPKGPSLGASAERVYRGGGFSNPVYTCRSANRDFGKPDHTSSNLGFRIVYAPGRN
jgi:formylglycine-generating enzyme required for sulfatase activity/serine/threonine protein kinase